MLFSLLLFAFTPGARATSVLPLNLEQLSQQASTIIYARVVANRVEKDSASGQAATYTDFEVLETIKGKTGATHTIKQLGGRLPGSAYSLRVQIGRA
ncbi:MAG TPA: hypothetical protein ENJ64_02950, partial [Thiotrichales bacterium]|nr:hypothetical protein [Thiotrichales bacterium]